MPPATMLTKMVIPKARSKFEGSKKSFPIIKNAT